MEESTEKNAALDKNTSQKHTSFEELMAFLKSEEGKKYIKELFSRERHGTKCYAK